MTPERRLFTTMQSHRGFVEFGNNGKLPVRGRGDIEVRLGVRTHTMRDVSYVPGLSVNLLSIAALDRRGIHVVFGDRGVRMIDKVTKHVIATGKAKDGLYELNNSTSEQAFVSQSSPQPSSSTESMTPVEPQTEPHADPPAEPQAEPQARPRRTSPVTFEVMHKRLGHAGAYRLKDLHLHASGVTEITVPEHFQCDVCDATKMVATINREPSIRTTVPGARLHTDFWGPYPVGSIIGVCKLFVTLIDGPQSCPSCGLVDEGDKQPAPPDDTSYWVWSPEVSMESSSWYCCPNRWFSVDGGHHLGGVTYIALEALWDGDLCEQYLSHVDSATISSSWSHCKYFNL